MARQRSRKRLSLANAALPEPLTTLIGREYELAEIAALFAQERVRLLTLTGPAGVGKTRLAIQAASKLRDDQSREVVFVNLTSVQESDRVLPAIAQVLKVRSGDTSSPRDALVTALAQRHVLLVVDNFEQVLSAGRMLADVLGACPNVTALVTSRASLNIRGEHEMTVPPLAVPDLRRPPIAETLERTPAVTLFLERARAAQPDFAILSAEQEYQIAAICVHLDGLPLAIELAAARIRHFSLGELHERLTGTAPLGALAHGARDLAAHQQTMRSAIQWSYTLLLPQERRTFCLLSVFVGGATADGIAAVSALDSDLAIELLSALVDQSLVRIARRDATTRYIQLVTLRAYGSEQLQASGEIDEARRHHAEYFASLAEALEPRLIRCEPDALMQLSDEHDNIRSALHWTLGSASPALALLGLRLAAAVWNFWEIRGLLVEGLEHLENVITRIATTEDGQARTALAKVWTGILVLSYRLNRYERAYQAGEVSLGLRRTLGDEKETALALNNLGNVAIVLGRYETAEALYDESLAINDAIRHPLGKVKPLLNLGMLKRKLRQYAEAQAFYQQSLALGEETGEDDQGRAILWNNIGDIAILRDDPAAALPALQQGLALFEGLHSTWGAAMSAYDLGRCAYARHDVEEAARQLNKCVDLRDEIGDVAGAAQARGTLARVRLDQQDRPGAVELVGAALRALSGLKQVEALWSVLEVVGALACAKNHADTALRLYAVASKQRDDILDVIDPREYDMRARDLESLRTALGENTYEGTLASARSLSLGEALSLAWLELT